MNAVHASPTALAGFVRSARVLAASAAILWLPTVASAQNSVDEVANYTGADRQQMLEEGAKAEGALMVYSTGLQIPDLITRFEQKYPFIDVEMIGATAADTSRRFIEEFSAGVYTADVFELDTSGLIVPRDQGLLQPFTSPEMENYPSAAIEAGRHWVSVREGYTGIGINTDKIPPEEAPKTYADLLDPKWRGRLAISGNSGTSTNWTGALVLTMGEDFVRQLGQQDIRVYQASGRAIANLVVSGEVELSPTIYLAHAEKSRGEGAHISWIAPGPVPVLDTATAVAAKAPHPHAAMLFVDFLLSEEGQLMYRDLGYMSSRAGMPEAGLPEVEKLFLTNRPTYTEDFEKWNALFKEVFLTGEVLTIAE